MREEGGAYPVTSSCFSTTCDSWKSTKKGVAPFICDSPSSDPSIVANTIFVPPSAASML
jgi:hypothetical protein